MGFINCVAVDKDKPRKPLASVLQLDLSKEENQAILFSWLKNPNTKAVFLAPPCGTSSAARLIPIANMKNPPKPLRTPEQPDGVDSLQGRDFLRVGLANKLYHLVADIFRECVRLGILVMVENPRGSLFWQTSFWTDLQADVTIYHQDHQACAYGSERDKWTRMCASFPEVSFICKTCDGSHSHAPWGVQMVDGKPVYATSLEVHYPKQLCDAIRDAFLLNFAKQGLSLDSPLTLQQQATTATYKQLATSKVPPVLSEFSHKLCLLYLHDQVVWPSLNITPKSLKLLHKSDLGRNGVKKFGNCRQEAVDTLKSVGLDCKLVETVDNNLEFSMLQVVGVQWEPEQFVQKVLQVPHPFEVEQAIPVELKETLQFVCSRGEVEVAKQRLLFVRKWNKRARELEGAERQLKNEMDPAVARAVQCKRILLFEEMLKELGYKDCGVVAELREGAGLIGEVPITDMLPYKFAPALLSEETLGMTAKLVRPKFNQRGTGSGDPEIDDTVWKQTLQELEDGWLKGPIPLTDIPDTCPISKRFGIRQGNKIRMIDNFAESSINDAVTVHESPVLHTVDIAAAMVGVYFKACKQSGKATSLVTRTYDLSSAYKQVAIHPDSRRYGLLYVYNPTAEDWEYFETQVLPFGAVRSVHCFLRLARAVWFVGTVGLRIPWTSFFDDFVVVSCPGLARSTELAIESLFRLLGWKFAESGKKYVPFSLVGEALGVKFDLSESECGICKVANTEKRIDELRTALLEVVGAGKIAKVAAQKLRGRMQFAEGQMFGRTGKRCIKVLSDHTIGRRESLTQRSKAFLEQFVDLLTSAGPRVIRVDIGQPMLVFTDACYEAGALTWCCGIGGVLVDVSSGCYKFFSIELNEQQRLLLGEGVKKQLIFEAETLSAVLAFCLWQSELEHNLSYLFVDNEGSKFALIRGSSDNAVVDCLAAEFCKREAKFHSRNWITRVSSYSNCADDPSRGEVGALSRNGFFDVTNDAQVILAELLASVEMKNGGNG